MTSSSFILPLKSPESLSPSSLHFSENLSSGGFPSPDGLNLDGASPVKPRALTFASPPPLQDITNLPTKKQRGVIKEISKSSTISPLRRSRSQSSSPPYRTQSSPRIRPTSTRPHPTSLFPALAPISSPRGISTASSSPTQKKFLPSPSTAPASTSPDSQSAPLSPVFSLAPSPSFSHLSPPTPPSTLSPLDPKEKVASPDSEHPKRPSLSLSIMTDVDDSSASVPAKFLLEDSKEDEDAPTPPALSGASSNPASPKSTRLPMPAARVNITRPQSTTAMESRRNVFDFGLPDEEPMTGEEDWTQSRNPLQRSHSVSGQFSATEEADSISSQMDTLESSSGLLGSVPSGSGCGIKLITHDTLAQLIRGELRHQVDNYIIVDCRYDYEYNGGHIANAVNIMCKQQIERFYHDNRHIKGKVAVIFHCEFSKHRGPNSSRFFRQLDRSANDYPNLTFPELYVLDGGYRIFYQKYQEHCTPNGYISMWDPKFSKECKDRHREFRKSWASKNSRRAGPSSRHYRPDPTSKLAPAPLRRSLTQTGRSRERQLSVIIDNSPQRELREDQEKGDTDSPEAFSSLPTIPSPSSKKRSSSSKRSRPQIRGFSLLGTEKPPEESSSTPGEGPKATSPLASGLADLRLDSETGSASSTFHFPSFSLFDSEMTESDELSNPPSLQKSSSFSLFESATTSRPIRSEPMATRRLPERSPIIPSSATVSATTTPGVTPRAILTPSQWLSSSTLQ